MKITSIGQLQELRTIRVTLKRRGRTEEYDAREISAGELDEIDRLFPMPQPPRLEDKEGKRYMDWTDVKFGEEANQKAQSRADEITRRAFSALWGTDDPGKQRALMVWEFKPEERKEIAEQVRNPAEVSPKDEGAADDKLRPSAE